MENKACTFLLVLFLVATVSSFSAEKAFAASGDVWYKVLTMPYYSIFGDKDVMAMAAFGGTIYVGVGRSSGTTSANVYRLEYEGCKLWDCFTPPWSSDTGGYAMAMQVFGSKLYVGTDSGEIWRTDGLQWSDWQDVTGNWKRPANVNYMAVFNVNGKDYLYATVQNIIWRTSDGVNWETPVNLAGADPRIFDVMALEVFNGYLYAGAGLSFPNPQDNTETLRGIQLWRTKNGVDWTKFKEEVEEPGYTTVIVPEHVHALKAFKGYLYVGAYHGTNLYRTDGVNSWDVIDTKVVIGGGVYRLWEHSGTLYLGMNNWFMTGTNDYLLYSSPDGITWSAETGGPVSDSNTCAVGSLLSFGDELYVGLHGLDNTPGMMEIWALGPTESSCYFKVINRYLYSVVRPKIWEIILPVQSGPALPDLRVLPPVGPRPPPPTEETSYEWDFTLVSNMIDAINRVDVPTEKENIRENVLADLTQVDAEMGQAMLMISGNAMGPAAMGLGAADNNGVANEVLAHLYNALHCCDKALSDSSLMYQSPVSVCVDIKPGSILNSLSIQSNVALPVAILGTAKLDVKTIDPSTIRLTRDPIGYSVKPIQWSYQDCNRDKRMDLVLKFDTQKLVTGLALESIAARSIILLTLTGNFKSSSGGAPLEGRDFVLILKSGT
jgi:hypothetical protein